MWGGGNGGEIVKRLHRILLNATTVLLLLLFVATAVLWVRSYGRPTVVPLGEEIPDLHTLLNTGKESHVVVIRKGTIAVYRYSWRDPVTRQFYLVSPAPMVFIPIYVTAIITAALPAVRLTRWWRRRRRRPEGCCRACGYDLRATPARCPECGTVVVESKA
jgi:hypothetical protein